MVDYVDEAKHALDISKVHALLYVGHILQKRKYRRGYTGM